MKSLSGLRIEPRKDLLCVRIRVQPRSSRNQVVGVHDGALKIALTAPPVEDRANRDLVRFLARLVGVSRSRVHLVSGHKSRLKTIGFEAISEQKIREQLVLHLV